MLESLNIYLKELINDVKPTQDEINDSLFIQNLNKINYFYIAKDIIVEDFNNKNRLKMAEEFRNNTFFINNPFENMWVELNKPVSLIEEKLILKGFGIFEYNEILEIHVLAQLSFNNEIVLMPFNSRFNWNNGISDQVFKKFHHDDKEFFMEGNGRFLLAIRQIIDHINNRNINYITNTEHIKVQGRINRNFTKFKYNPDHIIYVATEKTVKTNENIAKRLIKKPDFAYEVMGHWRRLFGKSNLGKNRQGIYCVVGRTWVKEHVRGQGELKKKTRLVIERV